jgi:hypothetical protein
MTTERRKFGILFLSTEPDLRLYKQARALHGLGHTLFLGHRGKDYDASLGRGNEYFAAIYRLSARAFYSPLDTLRIRQYCGAITTIAARHGVDLIHSSNMRDDLLTVAAGTQARVPVIYDVCDMHSLLSSRATLGRPVYSMAYGISSVIGRLLERQAHRVSAGFVYVSDHMKDIAVSKHAIDEDLAVVMPNYGLKDEVIRNGRSKLSATDGAAHVVYEGSIHSSGYGNILPTIISIASRGIHVHLHCYQKPAAYVTALAGNPRVHWEPYLKPSEVTYALSQYDYGLIPFNMSTDRQHLDTALPNKLFDYLAAGLPVLSPPFLSLKAFVESNGLGIIFDGMDDLVEKIGQVNLPELRKRVIDGREAFTIEKNIHVITDLYEKVLTGLR